MHIQIKTAEKREILCLLAQKIFEFGDFPESGAMRTRWRPHRPPGYSFTQPKPFQSTCEGS